MSIETQTEIKPQRRFPYTLLISFFILGLAVTTGWMVLLRQNHQPATDYGTIPNFQLLDQQGQVFSSSTLQGKPWIANFIFTRCPDVCPLLSHKMQKIQTEIPKGVHLVSFSVDPEYDQPKILKTYAQKYAAGDRWYFLTGTRTQIQNISVNHFHLALSHQEHSHHNPSKSNTPNPILHSQKFVLIDQNMKIKGYYDSNDQALMEKLVQQDLPALLH